MVMSAFLVIILSWLSHRD